MATSPGAPDLILPLPGNERLAQQLADRTGAALGRIETRRFPDGERYVRLHADLGGRSVALVATLARPDPEFLALVFAADAARDLGARDVTLVAPYLAYMRQDHRFQPGESISSRSFARLVSSTFDRLITVDPHLHRYPTLYALYTIPADSLQAAPLLADWIATHVERPLLVGPDEESEQWVGAIAARLGAPHAVLRKTRHGDRNVAVALPDLSAWQDRQPVLVDDIVSSGRTFAEAARQLVSLGYPRPDCVVVHALFAEDAAAVLAPLCRRVVSTDSVPHDSNGIELAPVLARALCVRP